jgi:hypothetical protein
VNGGNQYWQYQPPPRRSTARLWWFLGAAFTLPIAIVAVMLISRGNSGPPASPPPPRDRASYNMGYSSNLPYVDEEMALGRGEVSPEAMCRSNLALANSEF